MAKDIQFKAYDLRRKKTHTIASPPTKIAQPRLERGVWVAAAGGAAKVQKRRKSKAKSKKKVPRGVSDVLRYNSCEYTCLECGKTGDNPAVSNHNYIALTFI